MRKQRIIHASCVEIDGRGVLICGESGSGKTALTIELVVRGAKFVADDAVVIYSKDDRKWATAAYATKGAIGISPLNVERLEDVIPGAAIAVESPIELLIELDAAYSRGADQLFRDIPRFYLERSRVSSMAEVCERTVHKLLA